MHVCEGAYMRVCVHVCVHASVCRMILVIKVLYSDQKTLTISMFTFVGAIRVGMLDGELCINPSLKTVSNGQTGSRVSTYQSYLSLQHSSCDLNLIVACTKDRIGEQNVCAYNYAHNLWNGLRDSLYEEPSVGEPFCG